MLSFNRPEQIPALAENWEKWTNFYLRRKAKNNNAQFYWPKYPNAKGKRVNTLIAPVLLEASGWHCAYCDKFPLHKSDETIDHFKPKNTRDFYHLAYKWDNFFPVCDACQSAKMERFDELLLKPDDNEFDFHRFFITDFTTFELIPNPQASEDDQRRAEYTIELLGLKHKAHCTSRRHHHDRYHGDNNPVLEDYAYRYMFSE